MNLGKAYHTHNTEVTHVILERSGNTPSSELSGIDLYFAFDSLEIDVKLKLIHIGAWCNLGNVVFTHVLLPYCMYNYYFSYCQV